MHSKRSNFGTLCMAYDLLLRQVWPPSFSLLPVFCFEHIIKQSLLGRWILTFLLLCNFGKQIKRLLSQEQLPVACLSLIQSFLYFLFKKYVWPKLNFYQSPLLGEKGTFANLLLKEILFLTLLLIVMCVIPWQEAQHGQRINGLWYPNLPTHPKKETILS